MKQHYDNSQLQQLAEQVLAIPSAAARLTVADHVERLLGEIEDCTSCSYAQIHQRLLGTPAAGGADRSIPAKVARRDLCLLVEQLSDSANVPVTAAPEPVFTVEELAERFRVSPKTIFRWRTQGLPGRRWVFDGGKRMGFFQSTVDRFVRANAARVHRSGQFRHLTGRERAEIVETARQLAKRGLTSGEIVRHIAARMRRCQETVRITIRGYDEQNPATPVFAQPANGSGRDVETSIFVAFRDGATVEQLVARFGRSESRVRRAIGQGRARAILELPLEFMPNPEFTQRGASRQILAAMPPPERAARRVRRPSGLPHYLASLYDLPLLTPQQERYLFRKYNFLKFRAAQLAQNLDAARPRLRLMDQIEALYDQALRAKNTIISSNLRLVVSIAKRYVSRQDQFFERVSDGNMSLIRAVDKFDYARGNKFSTYATWAIKKNFARTYSRERKYRDRYRTSLDEVVEDKTEYRADPQAAESAQKQHEQTVDALLSRLDEREQRIVKRRFGIGKEKRGQTLQEVGQAIGVSKERVRQLAERALWKLRQAARDDGLDEPPEGPAA